MRSRSKVTGSRVAGATKKAKPLGDLIDAKLPYDKRRTQASGKRASDAADRLLREMDDVLKQLDRKR